MILVASDTYCHTLEYDTTDLIPAHGQPRKLQNDGQQGVTSFVRIASWVKKRAKLFFLSTQPNTVVRGFLLPKEQVVGLLDAIQTAALRLQ
jgi:hypothetical protein